MEATSTEVTVAAPKTNGINAQASGLSTVLPALIGLFLLLLLPGVYTVWMSVHRNGVFTIDGFRNLAVDSSFLSSLAASSLYTVVTVLLQLVLGVFTAAVVHRLRRYAGIVSVLLFLPYAVPSVVAVVLWRFLVESRGAVALAADRLFGIPPSAWMGERIFWTLVIISVWQFYPFVFVTLLARMRRIPPSLYLSSKLDGANAWQQFWSITLPQIWSTLCAAAVLRVAFMFTKFDTPWLLGGHTANEGVRTLPIYIYERHIGFQAAGTPGVAAAVIVALILGTAVMGLGIFQRRDYT